MPEWVIEIWKRMTHQYIRTGEVVALYRTVNGEDTVSYVPVRIVWGNVQLTTNGSFIRRDLIRKDAIGQWCYRYMNGGE